jgi:stage V sporulation protein R
VFDDDSCNALEITAIHDEQGYRQIRKSLAEQYNLSKLQPNIQVCKADRRGDRSLTLRHSLQDRRPLDDSADEVLKHLGRLWGFNVRMEDVDAEGAVLRTRECKIEPSER